MTRTRTRRRVALLCAVLGVLVTLGAGSALSKTSLAAPTISSGPASATTSRAATFVFSGPSGASFSCSLDGAPYAACTSPRTYSSLADGAHTFNAVAVKSGDQSSATTWTWRVDTVAPPAPIITVRPTDPTPNATNDFAWTDSEAGVSFQCSFENGAFASCGTPYRWVINTGNYGQHQFAVRAVDAAGNVSMASAYTFKYAKGLPSSGLPFQISGSVSALSIGVWRPVTLTLTNPNPVAIYVSALQVGVAADSTPSGCSSAANIEVQQSDVAATHTVTVPANGSVTLPAQGVSTPRMRLRNLPNVNQDVCKGKSFALSYSGTATN